MSIFPIANWVTIALVIGFFWWYQHRVEAKMEVISDENTKLKDLIEVGNQKIRLFEYCVLEGKIADQYDLSHARHPEFYTDERVEVFASKPFKGWSGDYKPKPEFMEKLKSAHEVYIAKMTALQLQYKDVLQSGAYQEFTDENFWLWFTPAYKHQYYYVSRFVKTGKHDWVPPDVD